MISVFSFLLLVLGGLNWLSIGLFQFDLVAGLFGTQASIFSRLIYVIIGFATVWLTYAVIRYKGRLTLKGNTKKDAKLLGIEEIKFKDEKERN